MPACSASTTTTHAAALLPPPCAARSAASGFAEPVGARPLRVDVRCAVYTPYFLDVPHWPSSTPKPSLPSQPGTFDRHRGRHHLRAERVAVWAVIVPTLGANQRYGRNLGDGRLRKKNGLAVKLATLASGRRCEEPGDIAMRCLLRTGFAELFLPSLPARSLLLNPATSIAPRSVRSRVP
jgi:hypothetical protein